MTWLNDFKHWDHIQSMSSGVEEEELLSLKGDLGFPASEQLCTSLKCFG